jgi:hypothetical protein
MPADTTPKKIVLADSPRGVYREYPCTVATRPGDLVKLFLNGTVLSVKPFDAAGTIAQKIFAVEDRLQGKVIGDTYAIGDMVQCYYPANGEEIYAWLLAGESIAVGTDELEAAGEGSLQAVTAETEPAVGAPIQTIDNSATGAVDVRCKIQVI